MGASGIVEMGQCPDEGEARFLANILNRLGIAGQAGGVPSHDRQPAPYNRLKGGGIPGLCPEDENLILNGFKGTGHCCITVAPERRRFEVRFPGDEVFWLREWLRVERGPGSSRGGAEPGPWGALPTWGCKSEAPASHHAPILNSLSPPPTPVSGPTRTLPPPIYIEGHFFPAPIPQ